MLKNISKETAKTLKKALKKLTKEFSPCEIYLYGSYAKNTWLKTSDLDLIIISEKFQEKPFLQRLDLVNQISWKLGEKPHLEIIPLTPKEFKEKLENSTLIRDTSKHWIKLHPKNQT